jgi:hypothetical protein
LTGRPPPGDLERTLLALPARLGGLGIHIPSRIAANEYHASQQVTSTLCDHIISQDPDYGYEVIAKQLEAKAQISRENKERTSSEFNDIYENLPAPLRRAVDLATEKGSSTWLTALPLMEHGFALHKGAFHDALALRYGWSPSEMPSKCACGNNFSVEHALSCAKGGFPSIRHNEIRDLTATLLTEVCHDVSVEPGLQPISKLNPNRSYRQHSGWSTTRYCCQWVLGGDLRENIFRCQSVQPPCPIKQTYPTLIRLPEARTDEVKNVRTEVQRG